jgi:protocatechuate 3,4-dioxygenase beta subunit
MEERVAMSIFPFPSFLRPHRTAPRGPRRRTTLTVEVLENRLVPSAAVISGFVYNDANHNGLFDPGETPIANSPIELLDANNNIVAVTHSDANGFYQFASDPRISTAPATITKTITLPDTATNWNQSFTLPQFDPSLGTLTGVEILNQDPITSDIKVENTANSAGTITATISGTLTLTGPGLTGPGLVTNLGANESIFLQAYDGTLDFKGPSGNDFGNKVVNGSGTTLLTDPTSLALYTGTGTVSFSEEADASATAAGPGNLVVMVQTTAAAQISVIYHYTPSNALLPGKYTIVQLSDPPGMLDGQVTAGNVTPIPNSVGTNSITVNLGSSSLTNNDFGEEAPASLAGFVYLDANDNGIKESGEAGIGGVLITLSGADYLGHAVNLSTMTSALDGSYSFAGLRAGTYTLTEAQPAGYLDGKDTIGTPGGTTANDQFSHIVLHTGFGGVNNNFGEVQAASLAGFVYVDANNNGVKDGGESGIGGVVITLTGTNDLGQAVSLTTQTSSVDGSYSFSGLRPGTYQLSETQPANYLDGKDTAGTPGGVATNDKISNISLPSGFNGANNDFGELLPASLAGYVYLDANNNGSKDPGEKGIGGVTVTLTGFDDRGTVNRVTTTAADGSYSFNNLRPGTYTITENQPDGYADGKAAAGTPGGTVGNDQLSGIVLPTGFAGANNDFGELTPSSLSGYVYVDANNDGIKERKEAGIRGVLITLTGIDDQGNLVNLQTTTNKKGFYKFSNLRPGTYTITETEPAGYLHGKDTIGTPGGVTTKDQFSDIVLGVGFDGTNNNFGERKRHKPNKLDYTLDI